MQLFANLATTGSGIIAAIAVWRLTRGISHGRGADPARGSGVVYIAWDETNRWYHGYWEGSPDVPPAVAEQMPDTPSITQAVIWGRERSPVVMIRPAFDPAETYWAGANPPPERFRELPVLPRRR